jgi:non-specific serine/threonine protein kinase
VELAPLTEPRLIISTFMRALDISEDLVQPELDPLLGYLESRQLLVVLDNCEHLIGPCAELVHRLLDRCAEVRVLATSREALRIPHERVWRVAPLGVPNLARDVLATDIGAAPAVQLFVQRARATHPGFGLTDSNAQLVGRICQRLDGLPLALELGAAWLPALGLTELFERLDASLQVLVAGHRTAPERQQTLRATLDWSHALLVPAEQVIFRRLSVFAGGWTLDAAEAICAANAAEQASFLQLHAGLVDKSLIVMEETNARARYRLLEPVRQYAQELLSQEAGSADVPRRHVVWYLNLAGRSGGTRFGADQQNAYALLHGEDDNIRVALGWSVSNHAELALSLAARLSRLYYWRRSGRHADGRHWLERVLELDSSTLDPAYRAWALDGAVTLAADAGEVGPRMVSMAQESVQLFRDASDSAGLQSALTLLGRCLLESRADPELIRQAFDESLRVGELANDEHGMGLTFANLAYLEWYEDHRDTALELYAKAVAHVRRSGDAMFTAWLLGTLGWYTLAVGDVSRAGLYKEEGLAMLRGLDSPESLGLSLLGLAHVFNSEGDVARLRTVLKESCELLRETGSQGLVDWLSFVGQVEIGRGMYARGLRTLAAGDSDGPRFGSFRALFYLMPRGEIEASLATARSELGDAAFQSIWTEGKSMRLDQAIDAALGDLESAWQGR